MKKADKLENLKKRFEDEGEVVNFTDEGAWLLVKFKDGEEKKVPHYMAEENIEE